MRTITVCERRLAMSCVKGLSRLRRTLPADLVRGRSQVQLCLPQDAEVDAVEG
jgi:hypothetical protein